MLLLLSLHERRAVNLGMHFHRFSRGNGLVYIIIFRYYRLPIYRRVHTFVVRDDDDNNDDV